MVYVLIFSAVALLACSNGEEGGKGGKAAKGLSPKRPETMALLARLPENTQFVVKFEALEKFYDNFAVSQNSVLGVSLEEKDVEQLKTRMGFNLLNAEAVKQKGFDLKKPFCLAGTNMKVQSADRGDPEFDVFGLLPVSDGAEAMETIRSGLEKNDVLFVEAEKDGVPFIKWNHKKEKGCLAVKDSYLYLTVNAKADPQVFLESLLANNDSLSDAKAFRDIASDTDLSRDLLVYFNVADMVEAHAEQLKQAAAAQAGQAADTLAQLRQYRSAVMTADLGSPDLAVNTTIALVDGHGMGKLWNKEYVNRQKILSITEPAALLLSVGLDIKGYYQMIIDMMPSEPDESIKNRMEAFREKTGIDIETDLLDNLSGSVNLACYDGASITMLNYNALFTAGVRDEKRMLQVIDKAIQLLPPDQRAMVSRQKVGETDAYVLNPGMVQIYAGVEDQKLLFASGKPIFEKALDADENEGFVQDLTDERLKNSLLSRRNMFYLNMDEVLKTVNNFAMFLAEPAGGEQKFKEKLDAAGRFKYFLGSSELDENRIKSLFFVKTRFSQPFFLELAQMIDQVKPDKKSLN